MAIKTREQLKAVMTQCGGFSYNNFIDFINSVMFRSDPDSPIDASIPTPSNETFIII